MRKYLDDILVLAGCILILIGVWKAFPTGIWFVAGTMCLIIGGLMALGGERNDPS